MTTYGASRGGIVELRGGGTLAAYAAAVTDEVFVDIRGPRGGDIVNDVLSTTVARQLAQYLVEAANQAEGRAQ